QEAPAGLGVVGTAPLHRVSRPLPDGPDVIGQAPPRCAAPGGGRPGDRGCRRGCPLHRIIVTRIRGGWGGPLVPRKAAGPAGQDQIRQGLPGVPVAEQRKAAEPAGQVGRGQEAGTHPTARTGKPAGAGWTAALFVGAVWAGMLVAALVLVWNYGRNVPFW